MRRGPLRIGGWLLALVCLVWIALGVPLGELAIHAPLRAVTPGQSDEATAIARAAGRPLETLELEPEPGVRLRAWFIDSEQPQAPTVLLAHGVAANRGDTLGLMRLFSSQGMAVLAPDARGHGESGGMVSYGVRERNDLAGWAFLVEQRRPLTCVVGVGVSLGAAELLQAISHRERAFCGAIADSSFSSFREVAYDRVGQFVGYGPWLGRWVLRPAIESAFLYLRLRTGDDLRRASPVEAIRAARVPILLIHGTADDNIPPRHVQALAAANPSARVWMVPNAGHYGAWRAAPEEYPRRVLAFVREVSVPR